MSKPRSTHWTLRDCLFSAFAKSNRHNPQDEQWLWAVREGVERLRSYKWDIVGSQKAHGCMRGCTINEGDVYFRYSTGGGWGSEWKICAGCMAMVLYFNEVDQMPTAIFTHWDIAAGEPVRIKEKQ